MKQDTIEAECLCVSAGPGGPNEGERQFAELQAIYASAPVGLCTLDTQLRYLRINDRLAALNGAPAAEHIGRTVREMAPRFAEKAGAVMRRVVKSGLPVMGLDITVQTAAGPGAARHWSTSWLPVKDDAGKVVQLNVWALDVTEGRGTRQQLEKMNRELALAYRWLNGIIDGTADSIAALDTDCRFIAFNKAWAWEYEKIFGRPLRPGDSLMDALAPHPQERDEALRVWQRALAGESFTVIQDFGGRARMHSQYECTYSVIRDADGGQIGAALIARDATRRIHAEERFRVAAECLSDVIFEWDLRDRIEWFGDVDALMGHAPGGFPRHAAALAAALHPDDRAAVVAAIKRRLEDDAPLAGKFRVKKGNGDYAVWLARGKTVRNPQGGVNKWVGAITDITERKRTEAIMAARLRLITFAQTHSLKELLQAALDEAEALTESRIGFFHFMLPDQNTLFLQAWSSNTVKNMCTAEGADQHYPVDLAGVWADCARERRPVIHNDYASLPRRRGLPPGHTPVLRQLGVPVMRGGLIAAVLGVGNKPVDYVEEDVKIVSALADFCWDIAENKRGEEALLESERRYRELVDNTDTGLVTLDEKGVVLEANESYVRMAGARDRERVIGGSVLDWTASDHREMNLAAIARCVRQGYAQDFETVYLGNDHKRRHILINAVLHGSPQGRHIVAFCRDITERKSSELRMADLRATLTARVRELEKATEHIRRLQGIIPICMHCHRVRDDQQSWRQLEQYLQEHSDAQFSHGLCPECADTFYPEEDDKPAPAAQTP
jgi:PAS domain S-box-containing protein